MEERTRFGGKDRRLEQRLAIKGCSLYRLWGPKQYICVSAVKAKLTYGDPQQGSFKVSEEKR